MSSELSTNTAEGCDVRVALKSTVLPVVIISGALFMAFRIAMAVPSAEEFAARALEHLSLPSTVAGLRWRWWTLATYAFVHLHFLHFGVNMLVLCFFARNAASLRVPAVFLPVYFLSAIAGAAAFVVTAPADASLIGASSAVIGCVSASIVLEPHACALVFGNRVKLIWVSLAIMACDMLAISDASIAAHMSHLAGFCAGAATGAFLLAGRLIVVRRRHRRKPNHEPSIDVILHKARTSGHSSLTPDERRQLFNTASASATKAKK